MTNPQYFLLKQEFTTTISMFFRDIFQSACQNQTFELQYLCYREKQLDEAHFAPSRDQIDFVANVENHIIGV